MPLVATYMIPLHVPRSILLMLGYKKCSPNYKNSHAIRQITANTAQNGHRYGPEQPRRTANNGQYGS